jgi:protein O-GlcNAc transferase
MSLYQGGRIREAEQLYQGILNVDPTHFGCLYHLALIRAQQNRLEEAVELFRRAIDQDPTSADALVNLAVAFEMLERPEEALAHAEKAVALRPDRAEAYFAAGNALKALGRLEAAVGRYKKAIALDPRYAEGYYNLGNALSALKRHRQAIEQFDKALAIRPRYPKALNNRGIALKALGRHDEALPEFDKALAIAPDDIDALNNRGNALTRLKRHEEALACFARLLSLRPEHAEAWYSRGNVLQDLKCHAEAVDAYDRALTLKPDHADALSNRGNALMELKRPEEAFASFEKAVSTEPGHSYAVSGLARCALATCDWGQTQKLAQALGEQIAAGKPANPFTFLAYCGDPALQLECAKRTVADLMPVRPEPLPNGKVRQNHKLRIAYLSADFNVHPTAHLMAELFELHDRSRFDIAAVSFGKDDGSDIRARLVKGFDQFHDVRRRSDREVAALIHDMGIDIAVDLSGYTMDCRPGILAHRPAPVQVSYLVFPATMGADFIDYVIADPIVVPFDQQPFFTEKIVHLPDCYQVNDSKRAIAAETPTREQAGLPEGFVFCCFNNSYKINPPMFDVWMRLLRAVEGSVLWLIRFSQPAEENLRKEAAARGIDPARLVFADRMRLDRHLARHRLADLFLDTLPYNAHTTASDALWTGLPLVTCQGRSFAGRVAASLLHAAGLPELVTNNLEEYEALALRLATEPSLLAGLRERLQQNRLACPLFDTDRFRRHIEAAYARMWEIRQRGESPTSFTVAPHRADA